MNWRRAAPWGDRLLPLLVLFAGLAASAWRNPSRLSHPALWAEDGAIWFQNAYNRGWARPLLQAHTGYLQSFPRLIADIGLLLPLRDLPLLFLVVALLVQTLPAALLVSHRFSDLVPSRTVRLILAACYVAIPNSSEVNANLTNAQWHLGLLSVLVLLAQPGGRLWQIFDVLVVLLSGLTGPFCLALLPVSLVMVVLRRQRWSVVLSVLVGLCSAVQAYELASSARGHFGPLGITWARLVEILGGQIVAGSLFGSNLLAKLQNGPHFLAWSDALLVLGALVVCYVMVRAPLELRLFNLFVGFVLAASLLTPVATGKKAQWLVLSLDPSIRYWFFPALALSFDIIWLVFATGPRTARALGVVLLLALCCLALRVDWSYRPLRQLNWAAQVQRFASKKSGTRFTFVIDPKAWHMTLIKH